MSFDFDFTKEHLGEIISDDADNWYDALCDLLPKYGITTERRVAHFLSQCAHESAGFKRLEENLNYSAKALRAVFGRYFGDAPKRDADEYHRQPEMIANYVYMDEFRKYKMGNTEEGDGWLVAFIYRAVTNTSEIAVLDAADVDAGPVASVYLDTRVPNGFHGTWVDGR